MENLKNTGSLQTYDRPWKNYLQLRFQVWCLPPAQQSHDHTLWCFVENQHLLLVSGKKKPIANNCSLNDYNAGFTTMAFAAKKKK